VSGLVCRIIILCDMGLSPDNPWDICNIKNATIPKNRAKANCAVAKSTRAKSMEIGLLLTMLNYPLLDLTGGERISKIYHFNQQ